MPVWRRRMAKTRWKARTDGSDGSWRRPSKYQHGEFMACHVDSRRLPRLPLGRSLVGLDRTSFGHRGSSRKHTARVKSPTGAEQTGVGLFRSARPGFLKAQPMRKGLTSASESDDDDNAFCFRSRGSRILEARSQHISAMLVVVRIQRDRHLDRRLGSVRSHIPKSWVRENLGC